MLSEHPPAWESLHDHVLDSVGAKLTLSEDTSLLVPQSNQRQEPRHGSSMIASHAAKAGTTLKTSSSLWELRAYFQILVNFQPCSWSHWMASCDGRPSRHSKRAVNTITNVVNQRGYFQTASSPVFMTCSVSILTIPVQRPTVPVISTIQLALPP